MFLERPGWVEGGVCRTAWVVGLHQPLRERFKASWDSRSVHPGLVQDDTRSSRMHVQEIYIKVAIGRYQLVSRTSQVLNRYKKDGLTGNIINVPL